LDLYSLTDAHRARFGEWRDQWIDVAMRTAPMTGEERAMCRAAVRGMYRAAGLVPPPDERIVFVPSPFVAAFAGGFAAGWWHQKKATTRAATYEATREATYTATDAATDAATRQATDAATFEATYAATYAATFEATRQATDAATLQAIDTATRQATDAATFAATFAATSAATFEATGAATDEATRQAAYDATVEATRAATYTATDEATRQATWYVVPGLARMGRVAACFGDPAFGLGCAASFSRMWHGGNQWAGWCAYMTFFRYVAQLPIDYAAWNHYEVLCRHAGPRIIHPDFCLISDFPTRLAVDDQRRPHADDGPFCLWRDGSALYAVHGVRVPAWIVETPETITVEAIHAEPNAEVRRVMRQRFGEGRYLAATGAKLIHMDSVRRTPGRPAITRALLQDREGQRWLVASDGSTPRVYYMLVPPDAATCREAHEALCAGLTEDRCRAEV